MGWLYMSSMGGHRTPRDYLDAQFACTTPGLRRTILRSAVVKMHTYYAALEIIHPDQPREVVAIVCLVRYNPRTGTVTSSGTKTWMRQWGHAKRNVRSPSSTF